MTPTPVEFASAVLSWLRAVAAVGLFGALFVGIFWTPGLLLGAFAAGFAADSRTLSQALEQRRRRRLIVLQARSYRGGWFDSVAERAA